jgi:hypothetical protein
MSNKREELTRKKKGNMRERNTRKAGAKPSKAKEVWGHGTEGKLKSHHTRAALETETHPTKRLTPM